MRVEQRSDLLEARAAHVRRDDAVGNSRVGRDTHDIGACVDRGVRAHETVDRD